MKGVKESSTKEGSPKMILVSYNLKMQFKKITRQAIQIIIMKSVLFSQLIFIVRSEQEMKIPIFCVSFNFNFIYLKIFNMDCHKKGIKFTFIGDRSTQKPGVIA